MLCFFCVLQIFLCRVLSLPLTLKISQTCSLSIVYTVNIRKITNHTAVATNTCQSTKRDKTEPPAPETTQKHKAENIWKDGLSPRKETGNMYSSTDSQRAHAPVEMSKPVENGTNYRAEQNNIKTDGEPLADGRNLSVPARSSVSSSRPLSVQLCRCTTAVILGAPWGKNATPL